jgi:hypothetical protein
MNCLRTLTECLLHSLDLLLSYLLLHKVQLQLLECRELSSVVFFFALVGVEVVETAQELVIVVATHDLMEVVDQVLIVD